jgi:hypothetical protein
MARGVRRILDYYVLGMHAGYGLSNLAAPTPFLLLLRQLTDDLYAAFGDSVVDASAGNAEMEAIIRALYPEACTAPSGSGAVQHRDPVVDSTSSGGGSGLGAAPVIVVGFPRSGTTWLQRMFQAHPSLAGPDGETCLFTSVRDVLGNDKLIGAPDAVRRFATALCAHWHSTHAPDATRLVEKTPSNVDNLDAIVELFPDASIVGIYRDGRDVVHSLMQVQFGTDDPATAAKAWASGVRKMLAFAEKSDRIRIVRYEDMVAAPVAHVVSLLEWIGLPAGEDVQRVLEQQATTPVSQHRVRDAAVTPREERADYRYAGDVLIELGYATEAEVRTVKRRPGYAVDLLRRRAARILMRDR